ncbi:CAAX protease self-immunity-domain-containing protein [Mucidula mucida]|nr:CAAX protease self-immunity-domain-containing protein [Mucidula mucida]
MAFLLPPLSLLQATLLALFFVSSYVGSLYISKNARLSFVATTVNTDTPRQKQKSERWRDDPDVIRARLAAVSLATMCSCLAVILVLFKDIPFNEAVWESLWRLGFSAPHPLLAHLVTPMLFLGPLYAMYLQQQLPLQAGTAIVKNYVHVIGLRNVIIAPLTEEIVFRACMLSMYHLCGASRRKMIFLSPLWFGLAHLHHGWDTYNRYGRTSSALQRAILQAVFQLVYTTLFGFHCCYLFLRTGSILPAVTSHMFCNVMAENMPKKRTGIIAAYVLGVAGYIYAISAWTETKSSIYWLDDTQLSALGY